MDSTAIAMVLVLVVLAVAVLLLRGSDRARRDYLNALSETNRLNHDTQRVLLQEVGRMTGNFTGNFTPPEASDERPDLEAYRDTEDELRAIIDKETGPYEALLRSSPPVTDEEIGGIA